MNIAIFGFGAVAQKLAKLLSNVGHDITIGVREKDKIVSPYPVFSFADAIIPADIVILAIPFSACQELCLELSEILSNKIIIDCTNPLNPDWSPIHLENNMSAAEKIAQWLPKATIVKAFNTIFADMMDKSLTLKNQKITAFIASDNNIAKQKVINLAETMGFNPLDVGGLHVAKYLESMAHLNIQIAVTQGKGTSAAIIYTH